MNFVIKVLVYYYFLLFSFISNKKNALFYFSQIILKYNLAMNTKTGVFICVINFSITISNTKVIENSFFKISDLRLDIKSIT